jgi:DNA (cytosine-5)-methyltransferase 1
MKKKHNAISLFSSAGIGEYFLEESSIQVKVANEIILERAECFNHFYPNVEMICGDIKQKEIKKEILKNIKDHNCSILIATPPCQGLSTLGKNKKQSQFISDQRNYLIFDILEIIDNCDFEYILIENVPKFSSMYFPFQQEFLILEDILKIKYSSDYIIKLEILDAKHYGIPQTRPRSIVKLFKKGLNWENPKKQEVITLEKAIGDLPSLESGETSHIKNHYSKIHNKRITDALIHTPTGQSAMKNEYWYPKKEDGSKIRGFHNTYKRMRWDQPAHARTTYSSSLSSHNNVHPGRKNADGQYSDARVLSLYETYIVSSLPKDFDFPDKYTDTFKYTMIGEAIPPLMLKAIMDMIGD